MSIGTHNGFWYYTIGQRQGIGLAGGPWYVVAKNPENNTVFVSRDYYCPDKKRDRFQISSLNWFGCASQLGGSLQVKLRHGPQMHSCQITGLADDRAQVLLGARDQGIAPGQFAVFYEGDMCVGSGVIL
jgi:tRNA-specific 2-thiouridylase